MQKLLIATRNEGKLREYRRLLADLPLALTSLADEQITVDVKETGSTFAQNARLKAVTYAQISGLLTWADDSGLEVDAIDGRPGVYSARYAGPNADDQTRYGHLLAELRNFPPVSWTARFRCVVAIAQPNGQVMEAEASVEGMIVDPPRGEYGFGYDPIFFLPQYNATMAELAPEIKNQISHRAKAAAVAKDRLREILDADSG